MRLTLSSTKKWDPAADDAEIIRLLRRRLVEAHCDYDHPANRASQLQALARIARLRAALAGIEAT